MKKFDTKEDAISWAVEYVDDPCVDNERFSFLDSADGMNEYDDQKRDGCCGSFDAEIDVAGRPATVGCNYGH